MELEGYAVNVRFDFGQPMSEPECRGIVARLLEDVSAGCLASGGKLIGHVKCFAETPDGNYLYGSVTSPKKGATCRSSLGEWTLNSLTLDLNVLVYGIPWTATDSVVHKVLGEMIPEGSSRFRIDYPSRPG